MQGRPVQGEHVVHVQRAIADDDKINAGIVRDLATGIATTAPKAFVLVISNPVNSTVPIVAEVFKKHPGRRSTLTPLPKPTSTRESRERVESRAVGHMQQ